jgi:hypothetical protein
MPLFLGCTFVAPKALLCSTPHEEGQGLIERRKEDLGMYQNQLNYMQAAWTVGYVIGEIPSNIMLTKVRPRYWLPAMEVGLTYALRHEEDR